jgi:hypothetical protein
MADDTGDNHLQRDDGMIDSTRRPSQFAEDNTPPATPADDIPNNRGAIPPDHPLTDSNIDAQELYDEGLEGATGLADHTDEFDDNEPLILRGE